ncbi:MAG: NAD(P)/FAD-dependent oxidoreductase [Eubacteriales bacterium]|nr:NAD(P)/FAD-dependent oxidoreductase [Eubacteriales bacterium]
MHQSDSQALPVCIIGAGLTGLTAAWRLVGAGYRVVLLESTLQAGGMVTSFTLGNQSIEYIYHHIFTSDHHFLDLCREMDLEDQINWYQTRDAIYADGQLYPFSGPVDLLRFPLFPFLQRIRTGLTVLRAGRLKNWRDLESQTAADWLRRHGGDQSYQKLWQPLLRSKFDRDADKVSAVWIWNKFKLRGHSRRHVAARSSLGYMNGGFSRLIQALQNRIEQHKGQILFGHTAVSIDADHTNGRPRYQITCIRDDCSTRTITAGAVIATISGRQFASMASPLSLPDAYLRKARATRYKADLCLIIRLNNSLSPYYWTTICDDLPFVVAVEHTRLNRSLEYGGSVIYLSRYLDVADPLWTQSDGVIYRLFTEALGRVYPDFSIHHVTGWRLCRTRYAQPVISCGYSETMPEMNTPDPGIKLAGMAQIYPEDRGMNYAIRLGREAADTVSGWLASQEK